MKERFNTHHVLSALKVNTYHTSSALKKGDIFDKIGLSETGKNSNFMVNKISYSKLLHSTAWLVNAKNNDIYSYFQKNSETLIMFEIQFDKILFVKLA